MPSRVLSVLACLSVPISLNAEEITGSMRCEVMSNRITTVEDGRPKEYTGFESGFGVGDTLRLSYSTISSGSNEREHDRLHIALHDAVRGETIIAWVGTAGPSEAISETVITIPPTDQNIAKYYNGSFSINSDFIIIDSGYGARLDLSRYHKDDWQGLGVAPIISAPNGFQVYTLDCRTVTDRIEEVIDAFLSD